MKKTIFKKILTILDAIEIDGIDFNDAIELTAQALVKENITLTYASLPQLFKQMDQLHFFRYTQNGIDLNPAATILSRSEPASFIEALALFECLLSYPKFKQAYQDVIHHNPYLSPIMIKQNLPNSLFYQLLMDTVLFEIKHEHYRINPLLVQDAYQIIQAYEKDRPLISTTLSALYTADIVNHEDLSIPYRNMDREIIDYPDLNIILDIISRKGIPCEREETKSLQTFYKDTLFHEFNHRCPLCGIDLPHMLIASHIKPFRDCGHIYECSDYHNGLLLCRNHDYLFDQGHISFQDDGKIMISDKLSTKDNLETAYTIHEDDMLLKTYLDPIRRRFLAYHRSHIFNK